MYVHGQFSKIFNYIFIISGFLTVSAGLIRYKSLAICFLPKLPPESILKQAAIARLYSFHSFSMQSMLIVLATLVEISTYTTLRSNFHWVLAPLSYLDLPL